MQRAIMMVMLLSPAAGFAADNPDATFYKHAAEGGMSEVDLGNLAQQKSSNASVKDFGAMMVKDHSAANEKLKSIATLALVGKEMPFDAKWRPRPNLMC